MRVLSLLALIIVCSAIQVRAETGLSTPSPWGTPAPTPLPTVAPEGIRRAYMNCLLEADTTSESITLNRTARKAEAQTKLLFCENRKRDCIAKKDGPDCRTFVEEFAEEVNSAK